MARARPPRAEPAAALLALLLAAAACAPGPSPAPAGGCAALRGEAALQASLFLGRAVEGREPVSRPEWEAFAATTVTPRFPEGFTVLEGRGRWRDPATGAVAQEDTVVLLVVASPGPETLRRLDEIAAEWRRRFWQRSVGIVTAPVCAAF